MIGLLLVLGLVAGIAASIAVGLRMWAGGLGRRWRLAIAALGGAGVPMALAVASVLSDAIEQRTFALLSIAGLTLVLALLVGLPVAWLMDRGSPPQPKSTKDVIDTFR